MAHPSDATLRITLGREIEKLIEGRVERLIHNPSERTAGYIEALRDVQSMMNEGEDPPPIKLTTTPPRSL